MNVTPPRDELEGTRDDAHVLFPLPWQALLRDGVPAVEYVAEPYLPKGARIWVWGATGTVKSLWLKWQCAQLSRRGVRVSYFSEENTLQEDLRRLSKLQPDPEHFRLFHRTGMDLVDPLWVAAMLKATEGDALVAIDAFSDLWAGDEMSNREVQQFDARVLKPLQAQGVTPVVIHHVGHRQPFSDRGGATAGRGASALGQKADVVLEFKDAGDGRFTITYGKCRLGGIQQPVRCFKVIDTPDGLIDVVEATSPDEVAVEQLAEKMVEAIASATKGWLTASELRAVVGGNGQRQTAALAMLDNDPRVACRLAKVETRDGRHRNANVWRLADAEGVEQEFDFSTVGEDDPATPASYRGWQGLTGSDPRVDQAVPDDPAGVEQGLI